MRTLLPEALRATKEELDLRADAPHASSRFGPRQRSEWIGGAFSQSGVLSYGACWLQGLRSFWRKSLVQGRRQKRRNGEKWSKVHPSSGLPYVPAFRFHLLFSLSCSSNPANKFRSLPMMKPGLPEDHRNSDRRWGLILVWGEGEFIISGARVHPSRATVFSIAPGQGIF